jgi:hypothetical protein
MHHNESAMNAQRVHDKDCKGAPSLQRKLRISLVHVAYLTSIAATVLCLAAGSVVVPGNSASPASGSGSGSGGPEILAPGQAPADSEPDAPTSVSVRAAAVIPVPQEDCRQTCWEADRLARQMGSWS